MDAIKILEQRKDILLAEPDYHITVEPGIDEVEPTATSTPSKETSPEADDNNTIIWIFVIFGVVIVAAVVVIVTVKKKKKKCVEAFCFFCTKYAFLWEKKENFLPKTGAICEKTPLQGILKLFRTTSRDFFSNKSGLLWEKCYSYIFSTS